VTASRARKLAAPGPSGDHRRMECQECGEESDELVKVTVEGKGRKLCPDCHELFVEQQEIAAEAGAAMRNMMEYKGK
jgi:activator of 2-hydroxyglutaryl-CoA dehydratase